MSRVFCPPSLVAAAVLVAFPLTVPAQTATPSTSPAPSPDPGGDVLASLGKGSTAALLRGLPPPPANGAGNPKGIAPLAHADGSFTHKATGTGLYALVVTRMATEHAPVAPKKKWADKKLPTLRTQPTPVHPLPADGQGTSSGSTQDL